MVIHDKTNEALQQEILELRQEITSLKALAGNDNTKSKRPEDITYETSSRLESALQGGNMAWWEMDIVTGNVTFAKRKVEMLGYTPDQFTHYNDFTRLVHPLDYDRIMKAMRGHFEGIYDHYEVEYRILTKSGEYIWFYDFGSVVKRNSNGAPLICTGFVYDITDKKKGEERLQKSENMLQAVLDNFPGVVFWKDRQLNYLGCNQSFATGAGLKSTFEIVGKTEMEMPWGSTEAHKYMKDDRDVIESGKGRLHIIGKRQQSDGQHIWLDTSKLPLRDSNGQVIGVIGVSNDISMLKTVEQELINTNKELAFQNEEKEKRAAELVITNKELVFLAFNLQLVHEKERVNLAREIHDSLAQLLVVLKINLGMFKKKILKANKAVHPEDIIDDIEQLLIEVDNVNKSARRIIDGLRPEQLDLLGFVAAVDYHLNNFEQTHHIKCNYKNLIPDLNIHPDLALALFRILQESLNNILKHAMATIVTIQLSTVADKFVMEISDNGTGFDVNKKCRPDSYGLIGMKERIKLVDGKLNITSKLGEGTTIRIEILYGV